MKAALAIGLFTLEDQLSTGNKNTLSVILRRPSSGEPEMIYDLSV